MSLKHLGVVLVLLLVACKSADSEWQKVPVPVLSPGTTVQIRVVRADNPRLPRLSPQQMDILLAAAKKTVFEHFGVKVEFLPVAEMDTRQLFALLPPRLVEVRQPFIYDFKAASGDHEKLADGMLQTFKRNGTTLEQGYGFARPYLPQIIAPADLPQFSRMLTDTMLARLDEWKKVTAADGRPVLDEQPYNEWIYWESLGYGKLPGELVITNQLLASAEYIDVDIHSALRGGVSVGTTTYSRNSPFGAFVFWSTFPFQDLSPHTVALRGGERYSAEEAARLSGIYLAHEIGHLLFQFGHPFGQQSCVMNPVSLLRFREWSQNIASKTCPIDSRPEMKVGAVPPYFNRDWLKMAGEK